MDPRRTPRWAGLLLASALIAGCTAAPSAEIVGPDEAQQDGLVEAAADPQGAERDPWRAEHLALDGADVRAPATGSDGETTARWSPDCLAVDGTDVRAVLDDDIGAPCR